MYCVNCNLGNDRLRELDEIVSKLERPLVHISAAISGRYVPEGHPSTTFPSRTKSSRSSLDNKFLKYLLSSMRAAARRVCTAAVEAIVPQGQHDEYIKSYSVILGAESLELGMEQNFLSVHRSL